MNKNKHKQTLLGEVGAGKPAEVVRKRNDILKNYSICMPKRSYISLQTNKVDLKSVVQISPRGTTKDEIIKPAETVLPKVKSRNIQGHGKKNSFQSSSVVQYTRTKEGTITSEDSKVSPRARLNLSNSNLNHMLKVQKAMDRQHRKSLRDANIINIAKLKEEALREERNEEGDKIYEVAYEENKQKGFIKDFLKKKDTQIIKDGLVDKFYQVKENFVNFKTDCLLYPHLRNHFSKNQSVDDRMSVLCQPNSIDTNTQIHLNLLKMKYQKTKDENKFIVEKVNTKKDLIDAKIEDVYKKIYGNVTKLVNIDTYDYNDYLNYKYDRYEKVNFADDVVKCIVLNNVIE
jgi:hypothetical protein